MEHALRYELISWAEVVRLAERLALLIRNSGFEPDVVVAISRGGYVPARLLCDYLDISALTSIKVEHYLSSTDVQERASLRYPLCSDVSGLKVLLVDDVNESGDTLELAVGHLHSLAPREVRVAVLHHKTVSHFTVDYYAKKIIKRRWLMYPWARREDLGKLISSLSPKPTSIAETRAMLSEHYQIRLSARELERLADFPWPESDCGPT